MEKEKKDVKKIRKGPVIVGRLILLILVIVGGYLGYTKLYDSFTYCSTEDASLDGKSAKISSSMPGRITEVKVEEGQEVEAGQVLLTLDDTALKAQEAQAVASINYSRKNLELAGIALNKSKDDFTRIKNLYNKGVTTEESYAHASSALETSRAQYQLAEAQIETSSAQLGILEAQLKNTIITTPIAGWVNNLENSVGDVIQPSQTLLSVNDLNDLWIVANIKETEINRIKVGADVIITIDAFPKREFMGTVEIIQSGIVAPAFQIGEFTKTTQRIPIRIKLNEMPVKGEENLPLLPGMSVEVKINAPKW
jgi:membrane fusion protein (multidrug efflux system)